MTATYTPTDVSTATARAPVRDPAPEAVAHRHRRRPGRRRRHRRRRRRRPRRRRLARDRPGEAIPVLGFGQLTLMCTAVGVLIARTLGRRARRPRSTFVRTTIVLTALSIVPDVILSAATSTSHPVLTHLVAAAIVIPALARRLPERAPALPDPQALAFRFRPSRLTSQATSPPRRRTPIPGRSASFSAAGVWPSLHRVPTDGLPARLGSRPSRPRCARRRSGRGRACGASRAVSTGRTTRRTRSVHITVGTGTTNFWAPMSEAPATKRTA